MADSGSSPAFFPAGGQRSVISLAKRAKVRFMVFQRPKPNSPPGFGGAYKLAKHRATRGLTGTTIHAVKKAVESGRISPPSKATGWFNFKKANKEWKANTGPARGLKPKAWKRVSKPGNSQVTLSHHGDVAGDEPDFGLLDPEQNPTARLTVARAEKAEADAALAILQLHERASSLVSLKLVQDAVLRINRITRDALLTVPDRVASQVAACSNAAEVHEILLAEIRLALTSLAEMPVEEFWKRSGRRRSSRTLRSSWS